MARARRTRFAAPLVVIAAAGCSHKPGGPEINGKRVQMVWSIHVVPPSCLAEAWNSCPDEPDIHCNPPPPIPIACPAGVSTDGTTKIVSYDGTHCVLSGPETAIECPTFKPPPDAAAGAAPPPPPPSIDAAAVAIATAPPRTWHAQRTAGGTCESFDDPCSRLERAPGEPIPPCNPPAPRPMTTCPPALATWGTITEASPGACVLQPTPACPDNAKCAVPAPIAVDCPP